MPALSRRLAGATAALVLASAGVASAATGAAAPARTAIAAHHPRFLPTVRNLAAFRRGDSPLSPPAPPCPLPASVAGPAGSSCVKLPQFPATGAPTLGNMAYWGGHVQVHPKVYLVFFGWGRRGAFPADCGRPEGLRERSITVTLPCDPDGAGKRMADFVSELGGTPWAGVQSQYYQVVNGRRTAISNDVNQLGGIWADDVHPITAKVTYRDMAVEAERAAVHFHIPAADFINSNIVIAQPQNFSDPVAQASGYCAFHDYIRGDVDPKDYKGLTPGLPYTNLPYVLNQGAGCGQRLVNAGLAGQLDGVTIALGHEIEETTTDPAAGDVIGNTPIGGWYDPLDSNENGDKCAYVGNSPFGGSLPVPGRGGNIRGNRGDSFPVQSLWSNQAAGGAGYCAGAGTDVPF